MRINVDSKVATDPRFRRLARLMNWPIEFVVGAVALGPWQAALERVDDDNPDGLLSVDDAEDSTDHRTLIENMRAAGLATERNPGLLYFAGISERADYLRLQRRKGKLGGRPKKPPAFELAGKTEPAAKPELPKSCQTESLLSGSGSGSGSGSSSGYIAPRRAEAPPPAQTTLAIVRGTPASPESANGPDYTRALAAFDTAYRQRTGGKRHTWGDKHGANLKRLLKAHGVEHVLANIARLFERAWWFVDEGTVPTFDVFVTHFDKLTAPAEPPLPERLDPELASYVEGDAWFRTGDLAAVERRLTARGLDLPWRRSPVRARMTHDRCGEPLEPVALEKGKP
jgi:hypothetical protein